MAFSAPIATALTVASTAASVAQGVQQQRSAAKVARAQANYDQRRTQIELAKQRRQLESAKSSHRARLAANGVKLSGSPNLVLEDLEKESALDEDIIRRGGEARALASSARERAYRNRGVSRLIAGGARAGTSLLNQRESFGF